MTRKSITAQQMLDAVADSVCWQQGVGYEWECDAVIGAAELRALIVLAAKAPRHEKAKMFKFAEEAA